MEIKIKKGMIIQIGQKPSVDKSAQGLIYEVVDVMSTSGKSTRTYGKVTHDPGHWGMSDVRHTFDPEYDSIVTFSNEHAVTFLKDQDEG
jgi:hypothetical protein